MITDEKGREWLLKKLYDAGCRNINVQFGLAMGFIEKNGCVEAKVCFPANIIGFDKGIGIIDIAEELGIVDWSKVAVDTPILVKQHEQDKWEKRHFAYFKDGRVCAWVCGATSWSADYGDDITNWNFAKLAEV